MEISFCRSESSLSSFSVTARYNIICKLVSLVYGRELEVENDVEVNKYNILCRRIISLVVMMEELSFGNS